MQVDLANVRYATFWDRFFASLLDSIVQLCALIPLGYILFGSEVFVNPEFDGGLPGIFLNWALPALYVLLFWKYKSATPGKIWMGIMIIDGKTGGPAGMDKLVLRYIGYFVCVLTLFLGFLWMLFDNQNRGLHDIIAGTLVIKTPPPEKKHYMEQ